MSEIKFVRDLHWNWNRWLKDLQDMERTPAVQRQIDRAKSKIKDLQDRAKDIREAQS